MSYSKQLKIASQAARVAGKILLENFNSPHIVTEKGERKEFVTEVDIKAEEVILSILNKQFPSYSIHSEEFGEEKHKSDFLWLVDPLDGTTNYKIHLPFFNVSIGLAKKDRAVAGVVYSPFLDELFYAETGKGAYLNGKRIYISDKKEISSAVIGFCHSGLKKEYVERAIKIFSGLKKLSSHTRQFGSVALEFCYLASGRIDVIEVSNANPYDVAAGALIAKEAGAVVTDFNGSPWNLRKKDVLATNPHLHKKLQPLLKKSR